jgi:hypothetical protein
LLTPLFDIIFISIIFDIYFAMPFSRRHAFLFTPLPALRHYAITPFSLLRCRAITITPPFTPLFASIFSIFIFDFADAIDATPLLRHY